LKTIAAIFYLSSIIRWLLVVIILRILLRRSLLIWILVRILVRVLIRILVLILVIEDVREKSFHVAPGLVVLKHLVTRESRIVDVISLANIGYISGRNPS
jgi:hypothetical protein